MLTVGLVLATMFWVNDIAAEYGVSRTMISDANVAEKQLI